MIPISQLITKGFEYLGAAWSGWRKGVKETEQEISTGWSHKTVDHVEKQSKEGAEKWRIKPSIIATLPPKPPKT